MEKNGAVGGEHEHEGDGGGAVGAPRVVQLNVPDANVSVPHAHIDGIAFAGADARRVLRDGVPFVKLRPRRLARRPRQPSGRVRVGEAGDGRGDEDGAADQERGRGPIIVQGGDLVRRANHVGHDERRVGGVNGDDAVPSVAVRSPRGVANGVVQRVDERRGGLGGEGVDREGDGGPPKAGRVAAEDGAGERVERPVVHRDGVQRLRVEGGLADRQRRHHRRHRCPIVRLQQPPAASRGRVDGARRRQCPRRPLAVLDGVGDGGGAGEEGLHEAAVPVVALHAAVEANGVVAGVGRLHRGEECRGYGGGLRKRVRDRVLNANALRPQLIPQRRVHHAVVDEIIDKHIHR